MTGKTGHALGRYGPAAERCCWQSAPPLRGYLEPSIWCKVATRQFRDTPAVRTRNTDVRMSIAGPWFVRATAGS
jgi:hypothetical protein